MQVIEGTGELPVIYSAHHASHDFGEFSHRLALTPEQAVRFSDYGTDVTVATNGIATLIAGRSRALGDLNRNPDDPGRFQDQDYGKPTRHDIWLPGQGLTDQEKAACQKLYYEPYHDQILRTLAQRDRPTFVVAWDNTAHYEIGKNEAGESVIMPPIVLSNRAREESADTPMDDEGVSCDPDFMLLLADRFQDFLTSMRLPDEVHLNLVYRGGYITRRCSSQRNADELAEHGVKAEVQSLQVEYDTAITHDQETLAPNREKMTLLKIAFSLAMKHALDKYQKAT